MITASDFSSNLLASPEAIRQLAVQVQDGTGYLRREIRDRRSTPRALYKPNPLLKIALKKMSEYLATVAPEPQAHVHGFVKGRSTVTNARNHLNKASVLRIDVANFFGSITREQVSDALIAAGFEMDASALACDLSTVDGALPIGFPTSPVLSNMVFDPADSSIAAIALKHGVSFTRYVDDLVFSGDVDPSITGEVATVLDGFGWKLNPNKTKLMKRGAKQFVTGLSVSDAHRPRVPLSLKRRMRLKVHYIERFGYATYMDDFHGEDLGDHPRRLLGLARYIAGVEPSVGIPLLERLNESIDASWYDDRDDGYWDSFLDDFR